MMSEENNVITLMDDDGNEHRFDLLNIVEVDDVRYAVMIPEGTDLESSEEEEEEAEAVIFRIEADEKGEEVLVDIEDDAEFEKVCDYLDQMMEEEDQENSD
jgi:putative Holliday junction resolvase